MSLMTSYDAKCKQHDHGKSFGEHKRQWLCLQTLCSGVGKFMRLTAHLTDAAVAMASNSYSACAQRQYNVYTSYTKPYTYYVEDELKQRSPYLCPSYPNAKIP